MKLRLAAFAVAASLFAAAPLALADIPNPTTSSSGTGGAGTGGTGTGGDGSGKETGGGCAAAPGTAKSSAAIVLGLGLLFAIPRARRRARVIRATGG